MDKQACYKELAENLPMLRSRLGLSQKDLADILGTSRQTVTTIENTKDIKKWSVFMAIMLVFYFNPETRKILEYINLPYRELKESLQGKPKMPKGIVI